MKILVFSDVHGIYNCLLELEKTDDFKNADKKIFLGDIVFAGSRPNECIEWLTRNNIECILGNNDSYICDHIPNCDLNQFKDEKGVQLEWLKEILTDENKNLMNSWHKEISYEINGKKFYFTHYPWESLDNDLSVIDIPQYINLQSRKKMFKGNNSDYIIFGHEHNSNHITTNNKHFYCLNSLGLTSPSPYLVIDIVDNDIKLEEKYISFDMKEELNLINNIGYPYDKTRIQDKNT